MTALEALKRESRMSYRQIADELGLSKTHVLGLIRGIYPYPQDGNVRRIRRLLIERARLERSSDPDFLAQIRQVAVPFLLERIVLEHRHSCLCLPMPAHPRKSAAKLPLPPLRSHLCESVQSVDGVPSHA